MATQVLGRHKNWQKKEENAVQTVGAGGFVEKLRLNTKPLRAGKYRIQWQLEARLQSGNTSQPKFRIQIDSIVRGNKTFKNADQEWDSYSGWDIAAFADGATPPITIDARRVAGIGTDTVEMRRMKVSIELMEDD